MPAKLLVITLDAAESTLIERWSAAGELPRIASLAGRSAVFRLGNCLETLPGAIWPELTTGRSCGKVGHFFHPDQLHTGEARFRPIRVDEIDAEQYYWTVAARAGRRIAALDQVHTAVCRGLGGVQLIGWGNHDRNLEQASEPESVFAEVDAQFGKYPLWSCDDLPDNRAGELRILRALEDGVERKTRMALSFLTRESWDLLTIAFTESHCAGHQFWHHLDESNHAHDATAPQALKDAIPTIYRHLDRAVGALVDEAGDDATVLLVASHGMGPLTGGYFLLAEVLVRLGMSSDRGTAARSRVRDLQSQVRDRIPKRWVPFFQRIGGLPIFRRIQEPLGGLIFPLESASSRASTLPNNRVGAIRLNLRGREPFGCVEPGQEASALLDELSRELMALEQPGTGQRIVARVEKSSDRFGPDHHPDLPDLLVVFRTDLGPLDQCRSPRVGTVAVPTRNARVPRYGDHTPQSRLWISGGGIAPSASGTGHMLDIAPTVLDLLDVPIPDWIDGAPLPVHPGSGGAG